MRSLLLTGAALIVLSQVTMAQTPNSAAQPSANKNQTAGSATADQQHLRSNLRNALEKAGYKDIRVAPTSFMVHARDSDGNPVVMAISPDSFTEVADSGNGTHNSSSGSHGGMASTTGSAANSSGTFVSVSEDDQLSSKVIGLDIYNNDDKDIGQVKDIAIGSNGQAQAYVVSVGGFLGVGERYVAINPSAVKVTYNDQDKKWHASMNASADQLKAAPEFKYSGRWRPNRT